jgi:hypothetical protein
VIRSDNLGKGKMDTIEKFLYYDCPLGFPDKNLRVYCDFEVGGAYEDWGWVIEHNGKVIACHRFLKDCLAAARLHFKGK